MAWAPTYASTGDLKGYLRLGDAYDDIEIDLQLESASRAIDHATNRQFGAVASAEERVYEVRWSKKYGRWLVEMDDLSTTAGFVVTVSGAAVTDYTLLPRNAEDEGKPYERLLVTNATTSTLGGPLTVTLDGVWGWASVPDTIKNAAMLQAHRFLKRRDAPFGVAGSPEFGSEVRLLPKADPDVELMVRPYRRNWPLI